MSQSKNISWYFKKQQCLLGYTITSSYKWIQLAGKNIFEKRKLGGPGVNKGRKLHENY